MTRTFLSDQHIVENTQYFGVFDYDSISVTVQMNNLSGNMATLPYTQDLVWLGLTFFGVEKLDDPGDRDYPHWQTISGSTS